MTSGDVIAIFAIAVPLIAMIMGGIIAHLMRKVGILEAKVEAKDLIIDNKTETISELKRQNDKLEVTGTLMNRFFSTLSSPNEAKREIQP